MAILLAAFALSSCTRPALDANTLVIGEAQEPDSLDPRLANLAVANDIFALTRDGLVKFGPHGEILPDLAIEVPSRANCGISADGRTIVYHLRRNVRWSDGSPVTARDVIFTWRSLVDPRANVPVRGGYARIGAIDAPARWTVRIHLKAKYAPALSLFADTRQGALVSSHSPAIGTGPYRLVAWHRGSELVFERNPYADRRAVFARVVIRIIPNEQGLVLALLTGEVEVALHLSAPALTPLQSERSLQIVATPTFQWEHLTFNLRSGSGPQSNVHVRRAIAYALDPIRIRTQLFGGYAGLAPLDQGPDSWARDPHVHFYPFDLRAARRELRLAGIAHPQMTLVSATGDEERYWLGIVTQAQCKAAGIDVALKNVSANLLLAAANDGGLLMGGRFQIALFSYIAVSPDPDDSRFVLSDSMPPNGVNVAAYSNPRVDALVRSAVDEFDRSTRARAYAAEQRVLIRDLPFYTLFWRVDAIVAPASMRGLHPIPVGSPLWNVAQWRETHRG
ncbi:MAG TPA: ABC transporter substrate-binding protein [Candidatus Binatia bacterium]|nr:ABC transporter substrate-binding protein [Candidatus Binatia bacterium]